MHLATESTSYLFDNNTAGALEGIEVSHGTMSLESFLALFGAAS